MKHSQKTKESRCKQRFNGAGKFWSMHRSNNDGNTCDKTKKDKDELPMTPKNRHHSQSRFRTPIKRRLSFGEEDVKMPAKMLACTPPLRFKLEKSDEEEKNSEQAFNSAILLADGPPLIGHRQRFVRRLRE